MKTILNKKNADHQPKQENSTNNDYPSKTDKIAISLVFLWLLAVLSGISIGNLLGTIL